MWRWSKESWRHLYFRYLMSFCFLFSVNNYSEFSQFSPRRQLNWTQGKLMCAWSLVCMCLQTLKNQTAALFSFWQYTPSCRHTHFWLNMFLYLHYFLVGGKKPIGELETRLDRLGSVQDSWYWLIIGDGNRGRAHCWQDVHSCPVLGGERRNGEGLLLLQHPAWGDMCYTAADGIQGQRTLTSRTALTIEKKPIVGAHSHSFSF